MIYITADTHGEIERFSSKNTKRLKALDTLFVAGDFGFVWRSKEREKNLKKLAKLPYKILFIDGYHEDFEALSAYPDTVYRGAAAKEIAKGKIYYIKRGEILQTDDVKILCFGGADDPTDDLFSDNVPNEKDFENCLANLEKVGGSVDYIITHSPSGRTVRFLDLNSNATGATLDFLDILQSKVRYKKWYFGCGHKDKYISPKMQAVYEEIYKLGE